MPKHPIFSFSTSEELDSVPKSSSYLIQLLPSSRWPNIFFLRTNRFCGILAEYMENNVSRFLTKIFQRSRPPAVEAERSVDEMIREVQRSTKQLKWLVKRWALGGLSHYRFQECVDLEQSRYLCISPRLWMEDPWLARTTLAQRDDALRYVLAATEAIEQLRAMGYRTDAIPEAKRRYLAKFCEQRFPKGWREKTEELKPPIPEP